MKATAADPLATQEKCIKRLVAQNGSSPDALIEVLHQVQGIYGYLPETALGEVARQLQMPLSRVYGVASFYNGFQLAVPAAHSCELCMGTSCFVKGANGLLTLLEQRLQQKLGGPAPAEGWELRQVSCQGACGHGPLLLVDGQLISPAPAPQLQSQLDAAGLPNRAPKPTPGAP
jgi:NADH:ubiquinone oxidoreductase subunit E